MMPSLLKPKKFRPKSIGLSENVAGENLESKDPASKAIRKAGRAGILGRKLSVKGISGKL